MIEHACELRVRYAETDTMGVLHHASWVIYWEVGRTDLLRARIKSYAAIENEDGILFPVLDFGVTMLAPARYDDPITIRCRPDTIGRVRLSFRYEGWRGKELLARGHSVHGVLGRDWKPRRLPAEIAAALAPR